MTRVGQLLSDKDFCFICIISTKKEGVFILDRGCYALSYYTTPKIGKFLTQVFRGVTCREKVKAYNNGIFKNQNQDRNTEFYEPNGFDTS